MSNKGQKKSDSSHKERRKKEGSVNLKIKQEKINNLVARHSHIMTFINHLCTWNHSPLGKAGLIQAAKKMPLKARRGQEINIRIP